jgi:MFS family permease
VRRSYPLLVVFVVWNVAMVANGGVNVSEVVLAKETLGGGAFGYGLMWGATGLGLVLGGALFAGSLARRGIASLYPGSIALFALAVGLAAIAPSIWIAAAAMFLSGIGNGVAVVANVTLVQRGAPDRLRGRAFTVIMSSNFAVLGLAMFAAGPLTDRYGARWIWGGCALVLVVAAAIARVLVRGLRADEQTAEGEQRPAASRPAPVGAASH